MDGNGRWGKKKNKGRNFGHLKGVETVKKIVKSSINLKIPIVTFYVFSSENWKRPKSEISFLFKLINNYFTQEIEKVISQGIKINIIGEISKLGTDIKKNLNRSMFLTRKNKKIIVNLAINYGSKNEIKLWPEFSSNDLKKIVSKYKKSKRNFGAI
jgi:undecaprenyl diphosphate synthase